MRSLFFLVTLGSSCALAEFYQTLETDLQFELRGYTQDAAQDQQKDFQASMALSPEWYIEWGGGDNSLTATAFGRVDSADDERSHADFRELHWQGVRGPWEVRFGISRVFWGRTELLHLVDTINQDDALENIDGEDKLGQPMLRLNYVAENGGSTRLFILPYFRERQFAGEEGRLRPPVVVDDSNPLYESGAGQQHVDWALRYQGWLGGLDYGVAWFSGTQRDPKFIAGDIVINPGSTALAPPAAGVIQLAAMNSNLLTPASGELLSLRPFYGQMDQFSIDAQYTGGSWLWKLEALWRDEFNRRGAATSPEIRSRERYTAATAGLEYSFYGVFDSASDIGVLVEYLWDERGLNRGSGFQDDVFIGARWAANDAWDSALLAGAVFDLEVESQFYSIEYSRRLSGSSKLSLEARVFHNIAPADSNFFAVRFDDYLQLEYNWYF
ncbi:MAG: hypothetical protein CMN85_05035 [Spongiibacteraceae bacterium]|nr:hypothetical protein [Spongiibacteraceae bacterium]